MPLEIPNCGCGVELPEGWAAREIGPAILVTTPANAEVTLLALGGAVDQSLTEISDFYVAEAGKAEAKMAQTDRSPRRVGGRSALVSTLVSKAEGAPEGEDATTAKIVVVDLGEGRPRLLSTLAGSGKAVAATERGYFAALDTLVVESPKAAPSIEVIDAPLIRVRGGATFAARPAGDALFAEPIGWVHAIDGAIGGFARNRARTTEAGVELLVGWRPVLLGSVRLTQLGGFGLGRRDGGSSWLTGVMSIDFGIAGPVLGFADLDGRTTGSTNELGGGGGLGVGLGGSWSLALGARYDTAVDGFSGFLELASGR